MKKTDIEWLNNILSRHVQDIRAGHEELITDAILKAIAEKLPKLKEERHKTSKAFRETYPADEFIPEPYNMGYNQALKDIKTALGIEGEDK